MWNTADFQKTILSRDEINEQLSTYYQVWRAEYVVFRNGEFNDHMVAYRFPNKVKHFPDLSSKSKSYTPTNTKVWSFQLLFAAKNHLIV